MRIYFGSVATRSEVQQNVAGFLLMIVLSDVTDPIEAIRNARLFGMALTPASLWVIRRVEIESGRLINAVRSIGSVYCTMLPAPL